ncbi:MAG: alpha-L-fucosidase [Anaerolineae bacterium]
MPDSQWFIDAKFGLFVHWGMYSQFERGEQVLFREHLAPSQYATMARAFLPSQYDPAVWAATAAAAGMKYAVLTAKHHDGFCLFDSAVSEFTARRTGPGRDLVAEYVTAFRHAGLKVGLYYSLADWRWPAYFAGPAKVPDDFARFIEYTHAQVRELCSNYGPIDMLWFDGAWPHDAETWRAAELLATIRRLQPNALVNNRAALDGDFDTPEQQIKASALGRPWEACITSTERFWGYHSGDLPWKTSLDVVHMLAKTAGGGGNLLLNVGPRDSGAFPEPFVAMAREVGHWLARNGESIYGTRRGVVDVITLGYMTVKSNTAYLHVLYWPGNEGRFAGLANRVLSARILADGRPVHVEQSGEQVLLHDLPTEPPDLYDTVIALELDGPARALPWAEDFLWQGDASRMTEWATS